MAEFETFTVSNVMPTGEKSDTYGVEYHIKFAENADTFKLWAKKPYTEGQPVDGNVVDGKFKKYKAPYNGKADSGTPYKKPYGAVQADKNAGMRQGMCINNAANFVNARLASQEAASSPEDWANLVFAHAQALYNKGDLDSPAEAPSADTVVTDQAADVKNVFGL